MKIEKTERGFIVVVHDTYSSNPHPARLVGESSAIGNDDDAFDNPGSSALWIGDNFHLNRKEVAELVGLLQGLLDNKRLGGV